MDPAREHQMQFCKSFKLHYLRDEYDIEKFGEERCPICAVHFEIGDYVFLMPCCGKPVDPQCLAGWVKSLQEASRTSTCPFCRAEFETHEVLYHFPGDACQPSSYGYQKLEAHHQRLFERIERENKQHSQNLEEAIKQVSNIRWPAALPSRLQRLRSHFERLGQLNRVLKNSAAFPSPEPTVQNTLIVPSLGTGGEWQVIREGIAIRLDFTSIQFDDENATGSRDLFFVYADFNATVKDLAQVWIKIWVRDQVSDDIVDAWFDKARLNDIPPLFYYQSHDFNRWEPHPWDRPLREASTFHSGQVVVLEHEFSDTFMNHPWQEVWRDLQWERDHVSEAEELRDSISEWRKLLKLKEGRLERLATSLPYQWMPSSLVQDYDKSKRELEAKSRRLWIIETRCDCGVDTDLSNSGRCFA